MFVYRAKNSKVQTVSSKQPFRRGGEKAQQFRVQTAHAGDLRSVSSNNVRPLPTAYNSNLRGSHAVSMPPRAPRTRITHMAHIHTHRQTFIHREQNFFSGFCSHPNRCIYIYTHRGAQASLQSTVVHDEVETGH